MVCKNPFGLCSVSMNIPNKLNSFIISILFEQEFKFLIRMKSDNFSFGQIEFKVIAVHLACHFFECIGKCLFYIHAVF